MARNSAHQPGPRRGEGKLYSQTANRIRRRIRENVWRSGSRLPALDELCNEFSVSLITVRRAVEILENEGLLERRHGKGTYVTDAQGAREWLSVETSWQAIIRSYEKTDEKVHTKPLRKRANCRLSDGHGHELAAKYQYVRRLHFIDQLPYAVSDVHVASDVYKISPKEFDQEMVIRVLARHPEIETNEVFQTITIGSAEPEDADDLRIGAGAPIGELLRLATDKADRLIYRGKTTYRGDLVRVETKLK